MMRVAVYPSGTDGCAFYRLRWVTEALRTQGCDVSIRDSLPAIWKQEDDGTAHCVDVVDIEADVAVFQRTARPDMLAVQRALQAKGTAVVVDIDDDLAGVDPKHPTYAAWHPKLSTDGSSWEVTRQACRTADLVTVSTDALARKYAGHGRVRVIRNHIPQAWLSIERSATTPPMLGWTGTPKTHVGDLAVAKSAIQTVLRETDWRFYAIGDFATLRELEVTGDVAPWSKLEDGSYAREYAKLSVAVVPLRDTAFNRCKSAIKGLEAVALGVPFVASPTPEYERLHELGVGRLAAKPSDWLRELRRLMGSADLRLAMAAQGRAIAGSFTIEEEMAPQVWEAWLVAAENRARTVDREPVFV